MIMRKINRILCPSCEKHYLSEKKICEQIKLICPECTECWPTGWFDEFTQFERFVERVGGGEVSVKQGNGDLNLGLSWEKKLGFFKSNHIAGFV